MRTTLGHRPARTAVGLAVAGVLTLGLVPLVTATATAAPLPAKVTFVDVNTQALTSADAAGANAVTLGAADERVRTFDVSGDGKTIAAAMVTGPENAAVGVDLVYSLTLTTTDGVTATTKVLSTFTWANPVVLSDGAGAATAVYWLSPDPDPYNNPNLVRLYKYDMVAGTTTIASTAFVIASGEYPQRLAVSPDGQSAAVLYDASTASTLSRRLLVAGLSTGTSPTAAWFQKSWGDAEATAAATGSTFTFVGADLASGFLYSTEDLTATDPAWIARGITNNLVVPAVNNAASSAPQANLKDLYSIRPFGGAFYAWRDQSGTSALDPLTTQSTQFGLISDTPASFAPWANGDSTYGYVPSSVTPPALGTAVNRSAATAYLVLPSSTALFGRGLAYQSYGFYGATLPGETAGYQSEVDRGLLQWKSVTGTVWSAGVMTSGAISVAPKYLNGTTPKLSRNTYFRWYFPGNRFVAPRYSAPVLAKVVPIVTAYVASKSGKKKVYGKATRVGGYAALYRYSSGAYRYTRIKVLISSTGLYNFGFRVLSRGSYQVRVLADKNWVQGAKGFRI